MGVVPWSGIASRGKEGFLDGTKFIPILHGNSEVDVTRCFRSHLEYMVYHQFSGKRPYHEILKAMLAR